MKVVNPNIAKHDLWMSLYRNEWGNARALLRHCIKLEKKAKTFNRDDWSDWMQQYKVKA